MAEKLNKTGLQYFYNRLKTIFASQDDLDTLSDRVDDIVSEGGEPNTIETVKVNGTALTPDAQMLRKTTSIRTVGKSIAFANDGTLTTSAVT